MSRQWIISIGVAVKALGFSSDSNARCCGRHHRTHWYYQGYNRENIYRHGDPELSGYRSGHYNGRYHDNTQYND